MAKPKVTCGPDIVLDYSDLDRPVYLTAVATESPTGWRWDILSAPPGSTVLVGIKGDFEDGIALIQNPSLEIDGEVDGSYCIQCKASNSEGDSDPDVDAKNGQQLIVVKTEKKELYLPPDYAFDWGETYLNPTLRILEASADDTFHKSEVGEINSLTEKLSPASADIIVLEDSAAGFGKKKAQLSNLPGGGGGTDVNAVHKTESAEINSITEKSTPVGSDIFLIEDSAGGFAKKKVTGSNIGKAVKLDDLGSPDDNTDLNATISVHGLLRKLDGNSAHYLSGSGSWTTPSGSGTDADAIHKTQSSEISTLSEKISYDENDIFIIEDSAALFVKKKLKRGKSLQTSEKKIKITIGSSPANYDSTVSIPQNAFISEVITTVSTPYNGGATLEVKINGSSPLNIQLLSENNPSQSSTYFTEPLVTVTAGQAGVVRCVLGGTPSVGAAQVVVCYTETLLT